MKLTLKNTVQSCAILMLLLFSISSVTAQCDFDASLPDVNHHLLIGDCSYNYTLPSVPTTGTCGSIEVYLGRIVNPAIGLDTLLNPAILIPATGATPSYDFSVGPNTLYYYTSAAASLPSIEDAINFELHVKPGNGGIACNDGVQITLDLKCSSIITPDMILEGDYCYQAYSLELEDSSGNIYNHDHDVGGVTIYGPGEYAVTVTGPFGNQCWSSITVEDKISNNLIECEDFEVWCTQTDICPGADIIDEAISVGTGGAIAANSVETFDIDFADCSPIDIITDVNLILKVAGNVVTNLKVDLIHPNGTTRATVLDLVSSLNECEKQGVDIVLDDQAVTTYGDAQTHSEFNDTNCGQGLYAFCGNYRSLTESLTSFNGNPVVDASSTSWTLEITNSGNFDFVLSDFTIEIEKVIGTIPFPTFERFNLDHTPIDPDWVMIESDPKVYDVQFGNNCSDITATYVDVATGLECWGPYLNGYDRNWTFTDNQGRVTNCTQSINVKRNFVDDIIFPDNYDGVKNEAFSCESTSGDVNAIIPQIELDDNGYPAAVAGVAGYPVVPLGELCSNFLVTYNDVELDLCGSSYKLIRKWTITDWCTGDVIDHDQIIKVEDNLPVVKSCPVDTLVFNSDPYRCATNIVLDPDGLFDDIPGDILFAYDCSDYDFYVEYLTAIPDTEQPVNGPFVRVDRNNDGTYTIPDIEVGLAWIRYVFVDACGNTFLSDGANQTNTYDDCRFEVRVVDKTPPNPVCIEYTVATLGADGCSRVNVTSFDNGSWDNCGVKDFRGRVAGSNDNFTRMLEFCCSQYSCGTDEEVELIVFDGTLEDDIILADFSNVAECINYNNCLVNITFQDDISPVITSGPANPGTLPCDMVINSQAELMALFTLTDFTVVDNCVSATPTPVLSANAFPITPDDACGGGSFSFTWTVEDGCGNTDTYSSMINFGVATPLNLNSVQFPYNATPIEIYGCAEYDENNPLSPEALHDAHSFGGVVTPDPGNVECSTTAIRYDDLYFYDVQDEGVCTKIVRTWTVIDWCAYDPSTGAGEIQQSQIIKLIDTSLPVLQTSYTVDCATDVLYNQQDDECRPFVKIILDASDDCASAEDLIWDVTVTDCGSLGTYSFDTHIISGHYYHGEVEVTATVTDFCGNAVTSTFIVDIPDCKPPTPYCISDITTVTLPDNLGFEIWASDFNLGSYDDFAPVYNCTTCSAAGTEDLEYYLLDPDTGDLESVLNFDCTDIPNGEEVTMQLQMWVVDPNGAPGYDRDYCTVTLIVQDNENDACSGSNGSGFARMAGSIQMVDSRSVDAVAVTVQSNQPEFPKTVMTTTSGEYEFNNLPNNYQYSITSDKNTDVLNGVSTLDILLIQRHLLNLSTFTSPYQYIAADANNSESVSAADMVAIRNVILERSSEYLNGQQSWRFVDGAYNFPVPTNPFPYDESIEATLTANMFSQDFVAVKIGDINNSAEASLTGSEEAEYRGTPLVMQLDATSYTDGEAVSIPVTSENFEAIMGMQYTLTYDASLVYSDIIAGVLDITEDNLGLNHTEDNKLTFSWNTVQAVSTDSDEVLFTLVFNAVGSGSTDTALALDNTITRVEAYDSDLNILNVQLGSNGHIAEGLSLYQNIPNPFTGETTIGFSLPKDQFVQLSIFDMNGKVVKQFNGNYSKGYNSVQLSADDLHTAGVFYYQMSTNEFLQTRKMIIAN